MSLNLARWKPGPLLPGADARDGALVFVVAVLVFLSVASMMGAMGAHRAATGWSSALSDTATVLVRPRGDQTSDAAAAAAAEALAGVPGVRMARALPGAEAAALLTPWIGANALPEGLPMPRLVALDLDPAQPANAAALRSALAAARVDATVDDHSRWVVDVERAARLARWAAIGIAVLVALAAAAVTVTATRAGLDARHEVIEVLHLSGARPGRIAGLFQNRFGAMGLAAGLFGGAAAAIICLLARLVGGPAGLTPILPLAWSDALAAVPAPLVAGAVAAVAARLAALGVLKGMDA